MNSDALRTVYDQSNQLLNLIEAQVEQEKTERIQLKTKRPYLHRTGKFYACESTVSLGLTVISL